MSAPAGDAAAAGRTRAGSLLGDSLWNVAGMVVPAILAIPTFGILARTLGAERFGLLTLAWTLVGYVALLDLGISRSVCWIVARDPGDPRHHAAILGSALTVSLALGTAMAAALWLAAGSAPELLGVSPGVAAEAVVATRAVALTVPPLMAYTVLQALLEGLQRFREVNIQRAVTGGLLASLPVAFVLVTPSLPAAVWGIVVARFAGTAFTWWRVRSLTQLRPSRFEPTTFRHLFTYGGWIAVSNFVSPLMGYMDRFWLANRIGAAGVAVYSAPAELIARATIVPVAIARALFPRISGSRMGGADRAAVSGRATALALASGGPIGLVFFAFAEPLLRLWLGAEIATGAAPVLRILALGYVVSALAQIPFSVLQARGHSRATALAHLVEVAPYFALLFLLGSRFGAVGVAWAWTARVVADYFILSLQARWLTR